MAAFQYDAKNLIIQWGVTTLQGFQDGDFFSLTFDNPAWNNQLGADGEFVRDASNDYRATITVTLMQHSTVNDLLSAQFALDLSTGGAVYSMNVKDLGGRTIMLLPDVYLEKQADVTFGRDSGTREWVFKVPDASSILVGGNNRIGNIPVVP